jgi:site-specific recombinase XerD
VQEVLTVNLPAGHAFRLLIATPLLEAGHAIRTIREPLGHEDVPITTMLSTPVHNRGGHAVRGPQDAL